MKFYFFFIGTEAELIKVFPVIREMEERKINYYIIASGQNDISDSRVLKAANGGRIDIELSEEKDIKKSAVGLVNWYMSTSKNAAKTVRDHFGLSSDKSKQSDCTMIVHGDTVSTVMGAYLGKKLGMKVTHIEAGLRSHNWLNPFPEEIDRMLVSRVADYSFAPGQQAVNNLKGHCGVYDTKVNTLMDSLKYALSVPCEDQTVNSLTDQQYFVFVLHRQENLENDRLIKMLLSRIEKLSQKYKCVIILHKITEIKFEKIGVLDDFSKNPNYVLLPRVDYFDFMKLLNNSQFVITDGGSNQEELSYMGKPALIVRKTTERNEGLGENAVLWGGNDDTIGEFLENTSKYAKPALSGTNKPSERIVDVLCRN